MSQFQHSNLNITCSAKFCELNLKTFLQPSWNVMAHGDAREGKWRGNWRMEWVASTLHTTSEHGVSSITTADAHTSTAGSRLNWRPLHVQRLFQCVGPLCSKWTQWNVSETAAGFGEISGLSSGVVKAYIRPRCVDGSPSDWGRTFTDSLMAVSSRTGMFIQNFFNQ